MLEDLAEETLISMVREKSFSGEEGKVAEIIRSVLEKHGHQVFRHGNNVWSSQSGKKNLPLILLNSHMDTVQPVEGWSRDPFDPGKDNRRIRGLGSNDAGASLVAMLAAYLYFSRKPERVFNLVFVASAEEEISGKNGIESVLPRIRGIRFGIVGEPTGMKMCVAEKGLMVLDCQALGRSGHAAGNDHENAIYKAMRDIGRIREMKFPGKSEFLGDVKMNVTQIEAGYQHNVVPDRCSYVVDVRINEKYTHGEILQEISGKLESQINPRSTRLKASFLEEGHPLRRAAEMNGFELCASDTLSDQALMDFPTGKIGPGDQARSHTADEYINTAEIREGIEGYIKLLETLKTLI